MKLRWPLKHEDFSDAAARRRDFRALLRTNSPATDVSTHELVFGELVSNAIRYGAEPMSVAIALSDDRVEIEVDNAGPCFDLEVTLRQPPTHWGGRGLKIVRQLVQSLTVEALPLYGCRVTATMAL